MLKEGISRDSVKKVVVTQRGKAFFYPKTLPRQRDHLRHVYALFILVVMGGDYFTNPTTSFTNFLNPYIFNFLLFYILELILRTLSLFNEQKHLTSRYEGDLKNLLKSAYKFDMKVLFSVLPCALYFVWYASTHGVQIGQCERNCFFKCPILFLLYKIMEMDNHPINDANWIEKDNGLNYGSGMAYSFFFGYLQYVLPPEGNQEKNLKELMQDYEGKEQVEFAVYKIFIMIPKSLNCPVSLIDRSSCMEMRNSLEPKIKTVAGVKNRVYKNSVYSIRHERTGDYCYACAEYATPLKTFHNVISSDTSHTGYYKRHKNDILLQFYLTLKNILRTQNLDNACELIFFDDQAPDGTYYDVGKIILNRIKELNPSKNTHAHKD